MRLAFLTVALGALYLASSGCSQRAAPVSGAAGAAGAASPTPAPSLAAGAAEPSAVTQQLTPGGLALQNLADRIQELERRLEGPSASLALRAQLVDHLLTRAQFSSTFSDFGRAEELAEPAPVQFPDDARAFQLRARFRAAVHRFEAAEQDLSSAEALGVSPHETELQRAALRIAQGRELSQALEVTERRARAVPSLERWSRLALAEASLGRFDAADEHFRAALASYRDVSPFPVAFVEFQRGVMWAELSDQPERAIPHYEEAVRVLPEYVVANVHLAELEHARGQAEQATARLQSLAAATEDPEVWSRLGELILERSPGDTRGRAWIERAALRYERLLSRQRAAFLDHAAEFFLGAGGRPALAVELARENLLLRQTGRAYQVALESALAAGDAQLFCHYADQAADVARRSRNLGVLISANAQRCTAATSRAR